MSFVLNLIWFILIIIALAFWIWMIIDCVRRKFREDIEKIIWILIVVFLNWAGALIYFFVVKCFNSKGIIKKVN